MPTTINPDKLTADVLAVFANWRSSLASNPLPTIRRPLPSKRLPALEGTSGSPSPSTPIKTPPKPEKLKALLTALRYRDGFDVAFGVPRLFGPVPADDEPEQLETFLADLRERHKFDPRSQSVPPLKPEGQPAPDNRSIAPPMMVMRGRR